MAREFLVLEKDKREIERRREAKSTAMIFNSFH